MKRSPATDPRLSKRAVGFYYFFLEIGRVISAEEALGRTDVNEGRDAIRSATNELKLAGYIKAIKRRTQNGQYITVLKFTDESLNMPFVEITNDGFSVVGKPVDLYIDNYRSNSSSYSIGTFTNVNVPIGAQAPQEEKGVLMSWPGIDEEKPETPKRKLSLDSEDDSGAIGKVSDKAAMRRIKYKKTKFEAVPASHRRSERPEEIWETNDLVAEFYDLLREAAPGVPGQINSKYLATWINKCVSEGTDRVAVLKAIRMFFSDPRNFHDIGIGKPIMYRFMAYYPTVHGLVIKDIKPAVSKEKAMSHQEYMLKLLEG